MLGKFESVLVSVLSSVKMSVQDYCDIETVDEGRNIVAADGSFASIVRFHGSKGILGEGQFKRLLELVTGSLSIFLDHRGHQLQAVFRRDLDGREALLQNAEQQHATAKRLSLAVHDLIDETVDRYGDYVYDEECYLVFWSRPSLLDPIESKIFQEQVNEFRRTNNWPATRDAQNLLRPITFLRDRHNAFVTKVVTDLCSPEFNCFAEILDVSDALRTVRASVYPDLVGPGWTPAIPGTHIPLRWKNNDRSEDYSEFFYPRIAEQIMTASADIGSINNPQIPDPTTIRVGTRVYAPLFVSAPPREPKFFNHLFSALNRSDTQENGRSRSMPFTLSVMIEGDGLQGTGFKQLFASLLGFTSEINRNINLAIKDLAERKRDGETIVKLRIAAMTWADYSPEGVRELRLRKSKVLRAVEGWGKSSVTERTGYVMDAFQSCCVGLSPKHFAPACPAPLHDALSLLPLTRPASPFQRGSIIFRSRDGKILNYQRFASEQTTWITLIAGRPGYGKSVLMNSNNFESCLLPGITRLPFVGIIDIGISSSGFIDLIHDSLPENMRHQAVYKRLQNSERDCINPMDTPLTKRDPLPRGREFLKNFLTALVTPPEREGKPFEGMSTFVGRIIDLAYINKSDKVEKAQPNRYKPGHNKLIDDAVAKLGLRIMPATQYWELVDAFFKAEMYYEAEVAQRYAVPTLSDLAAIASSEEVKSEYGDTKAEGGREIIPTFITGVREAVGDFPIFASTTRFDLGSARVVSLDLQDVAVLGSPAAQKQTSLMFMIARESFMKKVAYSREDLPFFDDMARPYFTKMVNEIVDENKVLCMDEFHKTGGHPILRQQILTDGREARKWNMEIVLASQLMEDFGDLCKIATTKFIMDSGTVETRRWMRENIGLTPVEEQGLLNFVHGPNADGATFLAQFETKSSPFSQLFTLTPGPMRLWALSTTAEDRKLRMMLYDAMPRDAARRLLAKRFPTGSCKKLVERRKQEQFADVEFVDEEMESSVIEKIAKDLIEEYFEQPEHALS